jgi:hypothetical protein
MILDRNPCSVHCSLTAQGSGSSLTGNNVRGIDEMKPVELKLRELSRAGSATN